MHIIRYFKLQCLCLCSNAHLRHNNKIEHCREQSMWSFTTDNDLVVYGYSSLLSWLVETEWGGREVDFGTSMVAFF